MPRHKTKVPKYLHHKPSGQGYSRITTSGKRHTYYFGKYNSPESIEKYQEWLEEYRRTIRPTETPRHRYATYSLPECVVAYQDHSWDFYGDSADSEAPRITRVLRRLLDCHPDFLDVNEFNGRSLKQFQSYLVDLGNGRKYVNAQIKRVIRFFRWLVSEDYCEPTVLQKLETVEPLRKGKTTAPESQPKRACTQEDFAAVLPYLNPVVRAMVTVQRYCGMRPGEVCRMTPGQVDRSGEVWFYRPTEHKTASQGKALVKAIPAPAREALEPYLDRDDSEYCFKPSEAIEATGRETGRRRFASRFAVTSYAHAVANGFDRAERAGKSLNRWSPVQLRKLAATEIRTVAGLEAAKDWLGHADSAVTEQHYAELTREQLERLAGLLENHWSK